MASRERVPSAPYVVRMDPKEITSGIRLRHPEGDRVEILRSIESEHSTLGYPCWDVMWISPDGQTRRGVLHGRPEVLEVWVVQDDVVHPYR